MLNARRLIAYLCVGLMAQPTIAVASAEAKLTPRQEKAVASARKFLSFVDKPESRTYRQLLQSLKPFAPTAAMELLEKKMEPHLDQALPPIKLQDKGDVLEVRFGTKKSFEVLSIRKNDPKVFATFRDVEILWADMVDGVSALEKMERASKGAKSAALLLLLPEAEASWFLLGGLAILGIGLAAGLYFMSRAKTQHTVQVQGNTTHTVQVPTDYSVNTENAITVPQVDPYLPKKTGGHR